MKKPLKFFLILIGLLLMIAGAGYIVFWKNLETQVNGQIDILWADAQSSGVIITGEKPRVSGFPFIPRIHFQGTITDATGLLLTCPDITYSGFPVPGSRMKLDFPAGLTVSGAGLPQPTIVNEAHLYIRLPYNLPRGAEEAQIRAWQASGGTVPVESLHIKTDLLDVSAEGTVGLDEQLQISGLLNARIAGLDALLADLSEKGVIRGQNAIAAQSVLQMLIQRDPVTGETFFQTAIRLQNRGVYLGPLRVGSLPELFWNNGSPPAPRQ